MNPCRRMAEGVMIAMDAECRGDEMSFKPGDLVRIRFDGGSSPADYKYLNDHVGVLIFKESIDPTDPAWRVNCDGRLFLIYEDEMLKLQLLNSMHGTQEEEA
jgi:hypothetical protein